MAFFSGLSSSIGKKLLLYGLRQIDILDKDPTDFVSVDVGKRTTLEVRDVGLHVKKLVALLHLKLPPEIHLSKARAALLRVTFVLDFGVPQISIVVDGIQIQARLEDVALQPDEDNNGAQSSAHQRGSTRPSPTSSAYLSNDAEHMPTVGELADSFMRIEPADEIRELEQELESRSEYLHESISSEGDDEMSAGMGAPLALPNYLRNILNTALDRLSIAVNNINMEVEDHCAKPDASGLGQSSPVSLNFHVDGIAIDSMQSKDALSESGIPPISQNPGKRRMRIENICASLVSDAENFVSMSKLSRPESPIATRSDIAQSEETPEQPPSSHSSQENAEDHEDSEHEQELESPEVLPVQLELSAMSLQASGVNPEGDEDEGQVDNIPDLTKSNENIEHLTESRHTVDEDRFADAVFDDETYGNPASYSPPHPHSTSFHGKVDESSMLYEDDGILDYAMNNNLLDSRFDVAPELQAHQLPAESEALHESEYDHDGQVSMSTVDESLSDLPTVSMLGRSFIPPSRSASPPQPEAIGDSYIVQSESSNLKDSIADQSETPAIKDDGSPISATHPQNSLVESQLFTHDDAESMYMSALSAAPVDSRYQSHVPGGWDSSSTSSKSTGSTQSSSIPDEMIAGSILAPLPEVEDGYDTPRPGTPQSPVSSPHLDRASTPLADASGPRKQLKPIFSIDEIIVWFPLGLEEQTQSSQMTESTMESPMKFGSPKLGEDSIFAEMPGSFSNYASSSTHRRKPSMEASIRKRANPKANQLNEPIKRTEHVKQKSPTIEVNIGSVFFQIDLSTGRILYSLFGSFMSAMSKTSDPNESSSKTNQATAAPSDQHMGLKVSIKKINIAWLENILTTSVMGGKVISPSITPDPFETIARICLDDINLSAHISANEKQAKLQIGRFIFASLDQEIISFAAPKSNPKVSSTIGPGQLDHDIEIDLEQRKDLRITVVTRPTRVTFDVQKLDEALSSFGGFSGMLELSSSISSGNTAQSPIVPSSPSRPRGVHFRDSPAPPSQTVTQSSLSPKIQVQLGDVTFMLKGRTCALKLQSTSIRMAIREGNVRLKVSEIKFDGPYIDEHQAGAPLMVVIKGTTVNFLFAPEETDLTRLISMITPSKDPYENNDDILIETLLRQRRKGSVLRVEVSDVGVRIFDLSDLKLFESIGADLARLSKVTKYLPDDDRPGLLTLASMQHFEAGLVVNEQLGDVSLSLQDAAIAHVGVPALLALEVGQATLKRDDEVLVHELTKLRPQHRLPAIMMRMVGDEMEPVVKAKLFNICAEYRVSTVMAALGLSEDGTVDDIALGIAASVATITGASSPKTLSRQPSQASSSTNATTKPLQIDLLLRDCALGLNPHKIKAKGLFVLGDTHVAGKQVKSDYSIAIDLRKASVRAIDDLTRLDEPDEDLAPAATALTGQRSQDLDSLGYVLLSSISAAKIQVSIKGDGKDGPQQVDVEFRNDLFVLESCADSTQTLIAILNGLQPPTPPSTAERYRPTIPLQQMMESFTGDALLAPEEGEQDDFMSNADLVEDEVPTNLEFVGSIYNSQSLPTNEELGDSFLGEDDLGALTNPPLVRHRGDRGLLESFSEQYEISEDEEKLVFNDRYFEESDTDDQGKARKWDSAKNQYHLSNEFKAPEAPLKVRIRDVNIIWNLYDGYDWPRTRNIISQAVDDVEARAEERRKKAREEDEDDDFVEEDFLFNSVWIGVPVRDEKGALARRINHDIDDLASETGSYAASTATRSTSATTRPGSSHKSKRRLKLERSKHKKIAFSLMGVEVDLIVFPPDSGETVNSLNVRVRDFEIFDHVPTSTWKKFVTCLIEPHARQLKKPMINLEVVTVKPVTDLAASELVVKVTVLPLRLHVDQDALDFITRFFEFKDDTAPANSPPADQPFIQRLEVQAVTLKLDYKPKRVDYRGLRSGHTTEFMNFLILDGSDIVLRHAIVYGLTSFDKVHKTLNDVWMPDVQRNQLPGVLSGLAAVRPLVNVGSGVRDLVVVPMREYKKDGRVVRSLQKGVYAFAKNTTSEVARLGAKVAIGTQNLLEGAETFLHPQAGSPSRGAHSDWDADDLGSEPPEETRAVSHYANQPLGVKAGLRSAARHLERDLLTARDAVIAIPAEVMEEGSGVGVAKALARHAPTVILRPALGATKALSNALLGVGNALDDGSRRKIEDKYKSY